MSQYLQYVSVLSPDMAEEMAAGELGATERGDHVIAIETTEDRFQLHLRRGMALGDLAGGLRALADIMDNEESEA